MSDMHLPIRMENLLTSDYYLKSFEPALIASVYEHLVSEKMLVTVLSKKKNFIFLNHDLVATTYIKQKIDWTNF